MIVNLLTEHPLEFLSLKGGCTGSSDSSLVKMPHCWKSHVVAQLSTIRAIYVELKAGYFIQISISPATTLPRLNLPVLHKYIHVFELKQKTYKTIRPT